jgi:hypothetical protein
MRPSRIYIDEFGHIYFITQPSSKAHYLDGSDAAQAAGSIARAQRNANDPRLSRYDGAASTPLVSAGSTGVVDVRSRKSG